MNLTSKLTRALTYPNLAFTVGGKILNRAYHTQFGRYGSNPNSDGNILDEQWDNLILLDACRYDYFDENASDLPGELTKRISAGSTTKEFIRATFSGRNETNLVYVTTNSWWGYLAEEINSTLHDFINLENKDVQAYSVNVEPPDVVADIAIEVAKDYPNKRLFIHFNQPHYPYIGDTGRAVFPTDNRMSLTEDVVRAGASPEEVRMAYEENLRIALPHIQRLVETLDGKTVVTADHGEMLGESGRPFPVRDYGHSAGIYVNELVEVPWLECPFETRKEIIDGSDGARTIDNDAVEDRLEKLGYI